MWVFSRLVDPVEVAVTALVRVFAESDCCGVGKCVEVHPVEEVEVLAQDDLTVGGRAGDVVEQLLSHGVRRSELAVVKVFQRRINNEEVRRVGRALIKVLMEGDHHHGVEQGSEAFTLLGVLPVPVNRHVEGGLVEYRRVSRGKADFMEDPTNRGVH